MAEAELETAAHAAVVTELHVKTELVEELLEADGAEPNERQAVVDAIRLEASQLVRDAIGSIVTPEVVAAALANPLADCTDITSLFGEGACDDNTLGDYIRRHHNRRTELGAAIREGEAGAVRAALLTALERLSYSGAGGGGLAYLVQRGLSVQEALSQHRENSGSGMKQTPGLSPDENRAQHTVACGNHEEAGRRAQEEHQKRRVTIVVATSPHAEGAAEAVVFGARGRQLADKFAEQINRKPEDRDQYVELLADVSKGQLNSGSGSGKKGPAAGKPTDLPTYPVFRWTHEDASEGFVIAYKKSRRSHKFDSITLTGT